MLLCIPLCCFLVFARGTSTVGWIQKLGLGVVRASGADLGCVAEFMFMIVERCTMDVKQKLMRICVLCGCCEITGCSRFHSCQPQFYLHFCVPINHSIKLHHPDPRAHLTHNHNTRRWIIIIIIMTYNPLPLWCMKAWQGRADTHEEHKNTFLLGQTGAASALVAVSNLLFLFYFYSVMLWACL